MSSNVQSPLYSLQPSIDVNEVEGQRSDTTLTADADVQRQNGQIDSQVMKNIRLRPQAVDSLFTQFRSLAALLGRSDFEQRHALDVSVEDWAGLLSECEQDGPAIPHQPALLGKIAFQNYLSLCMLRFSSSLEPA